MRNWTATTIAILALCVSIYQICAAQRNARINLAIDISTKNLSGEIAALRNGFIDFHRHDRTPENERAANAFIFYLDYVARLIKEERIERNYVSYSVQWQICAIFQEVYRDDFPADRKNALPRESEVKALEDFYEQNKDSVCPAQTIMDLNL